MAENNVDRWHEALEFKPKDALGLGVDSYDAAGEALVEKFEGPVGVMKGFSAVMTAVTAAPEIVKGIIDHDEKKVIVETAGIGGSLGGGIVGEFLAGAAYGIAVGGAVGVETGPGLLITAVIGAVAGGFFGERGVKYAV